MSDSPSASALSGATDQALRAIANDSLTLPALFELAHQLTGAGRRASAVHLYRAWLARSASPVAYAAQFNLAVLLSDSGDLAGAETAYRNALAQNPRFSEALLNLGTLLERLQRPEEALATWRQILDYTKPEVPAERGFRILAFNNLGRLLEIQRDYPQAEAMMTSSLQLDAQQPDVITHWIHVRQKQCHWPVFDSDSSGVPLAQLQEATSALAMLAGSPDPAVQLAAARRFVRDKVSTTAPHLSSPAGYGHARLRIGYLSSDFCSHAVSILTAELYGLHDRQRVEVYGFDWSRDDGSPLRARVLAGFDHHVRIHALSDEEAAHLIRSHEIDILVDLHGLTQGARPSILRHKPAPVQITWLGLPGTTALPEVDYVISDPFVLPPALEPYFTEKPLHMPRTFQVNDRQREVGPAPSRAECGLPAQGFVFCAFNNAFKITPEVFGAWMRILQQVPDSVLWLVTDNAQVRTNLARQAELAGVAAERLLFAPRAVPAAYLARFQVADLFLDTAPFNGGTTASDALWAGLPVLTCAGRAFSARMAGSLLHAAELPELVTDNLADYEALAVALAQPDGRLAALRARLAQRRLQCALFDTPQFVRDLEDCYERVALRGQRPATPVPAASKLPLVSVLLPTCDQPAAAERALRSVLAQSWDNIELVISDSSQDEANAARLAAVAGAEPRVRYLRARGLGPDQNRLHCFKFARGAFVNYIGEHDLFHPQKLERMMGFILAQPDIGLVTCREQPLDAAGQFSGEAAPALFGNETLIGGVSLGDMCLASSQNLVGSLSSVLFRRQLAGERFGQFGARQYQVLAREASWLAVLAQAQCVYLPETLSYVGPEAEAPGARALRSVEWLQLLCDACQHPLFLQRRGDLQELLSHKLTACIAQLPALPAEGYEPEHVHAAMRQATSLLLAR